MPTTKYIWDEQNYLAEADGNDTINVVYTNEPEERSKISPPLPEGEGLGVRGTARVLSPHPRPLSRKERGAADHAGHGLPDGQDVPHERSWF